MRRLVSLLLALLAPTASAAGQGQWEIEFHAGGIVSSHPDEGTAVLPAAGTPFTTVNGAPSRRESSWYFGDGAVLLNQVNAARGLSQRLTPLDPILTGAAVQRRKGDTVGVRISRLLTRRYTAEFALDYSRDELTLSDAAVAGLEAARASFASAFSVPLPAGPAGSAPVLSATSTATTDSQRGRQVFTTGVLNINLKTDGRLIPYATVGGGVVVNTGPAPSATVSGNYRITGPAGSPMAGVTVHNETDAVTLRYAIDRQSLVGIAGGGIKYAVSSRWGVRVDVRAYVSRNSVSNVVDANPSVATLTPPTVLAIATNPGIQFSNNASTGARSSLSGSAVDGFEMFHGGGTQVQFSVVPGVFWRF